MDTKDRKRCPVVRLWDGERKGSFASSQVLHRISDVLVDSNITTATAIWS